MRFICGIFEKWHEYERMVSDMRSAFIHCSVLWKLMFAYTMKLRQLIGYPTQGRYDGRKLSSLPMERQTDVKTLYRNAPSAKTL